MRLEKNALELGGMIDTQIDSLLIRLDTTM